LLLHLCLDKGYKSIEEEQELIKRGYVLHIPIKRKREKTRLIKEGQKGRLRIVEDIPQIHGIVERTCSWHNRFRKLFTRYERMAKNYLGLVRLACCMIIYRKIIFWIGSK
jgi:IS5 family transposase